ncbi:hypothetical protein A9Q81_19175 [Gammaproteobacteria bacterium 42_54_T18]|nr:hypothetical protein A9Q81_19175 [Gammaproteobacteria bacterium 42_54_T18]
MALFSSYFADLPIRRKLMVIISVALWVSMLVASIAFIAYDQQTARQRLIGEMQVLAKVIAARSGAAVAFGDKKAASTNVAAFEFHSSVIIACLVSSTSKTSIVLAQYRRESIGSAAGRLGFCENSDSIQANAQYKNYYFDDAHLVVEEPVLLKGKEIGQLVMKVSLQQIQQRLWQFALVALMIQFAAGLLAYLLTTRLQKMITDPLQQLSTVADHITGSHDYSLRAERNGSDEVGVVVIAFNDMLHTIQETHHQLKEAMFELEDKREQSDALARSANERREEISEYFSGASHDLRQPLHAMGLFVETLQQEQGGSTSHLLTRLDQSIEHLELLLTDLLDVSKLDAGVKKAKKSPVDIRSLFQRIVNDFSVLAEDKQLRLSLFIADKEYADIEPLTIHTDPMMLERVIRNLLSNAVRYTERGGILVACRLVGGSKISIEVWDTGRGIPEKQQTRIFESHHQLDNENQEAEKGFGLGLSVVKRLTDSLSHPLSLQSIEGRGTVFKLQVPLVMNDDKTHELTEEGMSVSSGPTLIANSLPNDIAGKKLLLLDDDLLVMESLETVLVAWGAEVKKVGSFDELKRLLVKGYQPDVILSDYNLEDEVNGVEAIEYLRTQVGQLVPALVLTGETNSDVFKIIEGNGLKMLKKPVKPAKLRAMLGYLLTS